MTTIEPNSLGKFEKNKKWQKRRKSDLLPANFDNLATDADRIEALRASLIVAIRLIDHLLDNED